LPGFRCQVDVEKGARELLHAFRAIELTKAQFEARGHTRIKQIRYLLDTGQIDDYFYWKSLNGS
jgi:hypothetical protein